MNTKQDFWAYRSKPRPRRWQYHVRGPFLTRQDAIAAIFRDDPTAQEVASGYGADSAQFDIRWITRDAWKARENG